jgi:hypothetical protein
MKASGSLLSSLEPAAGPYPEPHESSAHPPTILLYDQF